MIPYNKIEKNIRILIIILAFWLIYYICYSLEVPVDNFIKNYTNLRSEYTVKEQLSKFYLFIVLLISIHSYWVLDQSNEVKLSISFFFLGLILYMSESNMIKETAQPIFGLIIIACTAFLLIRLRYFLQFIFFMVGFMWICLGSLKDILRQYESISSMVPALTSSIFSLRVGEERCEVLGTAFVCLSAVLCFISPLRNIIARNTKRSLLILFASGIMTFGNGFLHYQYKPGYKIYLAGSVMTIIGFLGLVFVLKTILKGDGILTFFSEDLFYLFIFFFFVVLPSIHGTTRILTAFLLWLPSMLFMAVYMWRCHPASHPSKRNICHSGI